MAMTPFFIIIADIRIYRKYFTLPKKLICFLLLGSLACAQDYKSFAQETGYETNYQKALERAKKEHKDLMFLLITNYCPWCKKFEKLTLKDKDINAKVHQKFIPLVLNREEHNFPKEFESSRIPVVYFISSETSKSYEEALGFQSKEEFKNFLK